ncbi:ABC transporter substrate-binding protein [Peptacetobacter hominis]|nr:ABC transporter substrate-binding protein [Peptacetobacter hominis]
MKFSKMKKAISLVVVGFMLATTGCSNGGSTTDEGSTSDLSGDLTIYTSQPEEDIQALVEDFNTVYPDINVEIFRSGTEEVVSKVLAENEIGNVQADVLLVSDATTFESLKKEDLLESYESPELEGIDSGYYDEEHTYTGTKIITTGIVVNRDVVKDEVKGFADLTSETAKDNAVMPSPLYSGAASYNLSVLTNTDGIGWEFYEALKANNIKVDQGNGTVLEAVTAGEKGFGMIVDYMALRAKDEGANVDFIYPEEGSLVITEPIGMVKGTDSEELAKAFIDYILSEDGQEKTAEIGYTPIKDGIAAPEGFKAASEITNLSVPMDQLMSTKEDDKVKFATIFGE